MAEEDFQKKGYYLDAGTIERIAAVKTEHGVSKSSAIGVAMQFFMTMPFGQRSKLLERFGATLRRKSVNGDSSS